MSQIFQHVTKKKIFFCILVYYTTPQHTPLHTPPQHTPLHNIHHSTTHTTPHTTQHFTTHSTPHTTHTLPTHYHTPPTFHTTHTSPTPHHTHTPYQATQHEKNSFLLHEKILMLCQIIIVFFWNSYIKKQKMKLRGVEGMCGVCVVWCGMCVVCVVSLVCGVQLQKLFLFKKVYNIIFFMFFTINIKILKPCHKLIVAVVCTQISMI